MAPASDKKNISPPLSITWVDWLFCAVLLVIGLTLSTSLLLPGPGQHPDTIKYQFIGKVLGLSHPPGSPLYLLINWFVSIIPMGELAWRINLLSAICYSLSLASFHLVLRSTGLSYSAGLAGSITLGSLPLFLDQATFAEVYTLHFLFLVLALLFIVRWARTGIPRQLFIGAIALGLSYGVHTMTVLLLPGLAVFILIRKRPNPFTRTGIVAAIIAAASAILPYLYYAIRPLQQPVYREEAISNAGEFFWFVSGGYFKKLMFDYSWSEFIEVRSLWALDHLANNFGLILLCIAIAGIVLLMRKDWQLGSLAALTLIASTVYAMGYRVGDAEVYLLPAMMSLCWGVAIAIDRLGRISQRFLQNKSLRLAIGAGFVVVVILLRSYALSNHLPQLDKSSERRWDEVSTELIEQVSDKSLIVTSDQWWFLSLAYQLWGVELRNNDLVSITSVRSQDCDHLQQLIRAEDRQLYFTADLSDCLAKAGVDVERIDLSLRLDQYLERLPESTFIFLAIYDEGTAGLDQDTLKGLEELGITIPFESGYRWSLAAAYYKEDGRFTGSYRFDKDTVGLTFDKNEKLINQRLPFSVSIRSGGALSQKELSMKIDGIEYARELRGLHILVFNAKTGAPIDRKTVDTHRTASLMDRYYFKLR